MKRFLLFSIMFLVCGALKAQISVTEFKSLPNDLSARTTADEKPVVDMNGDRCALVKIKTKGIAKEQRDELKFTAGTMATYIAKTEYQDSDIRLWVNPRKGTIVIYHDLFGELRYSFPEELQSQSTYSMLLEVIVPSGYVYVTTNPEIGADVIIDGVKSGKTPYLSDKINIGEHRIQVMKNDLVVLTKIIEIKDNETTNIEASMSGDIGEIIIFVEDEEASIYVDNEFKAKGYWKGMIATGTYLVEARKEGCKKETRFVTIATGSNEPVKLKTPQMTLSSVRITTTPDNVNVKIDGKPYGMSPQLIENLPIGEHEMVLEKKGYNTITKTIVVRETLTQVDEVLEAMSNNAPSRRSTLDALSNKNSSQDAGNEVSEAGIGKIRIKSDCPGATVYINGEKVGKAPVNVKKEAGEYLVEAKHNNKTISKYVTIDEDDNVSTKLSFNGVFRIKPEVGFGIIDYYYTDYYYYYNYYYDDYFTGYTSGSYSDFGINAALSIDYVLSISNISLYGGLVVDYLYDEDFYVGANLGISILNNKKVNPFLEYKVLVDSSIFTLGIMINNKFNLGFSAISGYEFGGYMLSLGYNINMGGGNKK